MKAIVQDTAGPSPTDRPRPAAGPDEIVLDVARVLLRAIDHAAPARRRGFLGVPGGCLVGRTAEGVAVAVDPATPCGRCEHCLSGLSAACPNRTILGTRGRDGGLAEAIAVPTANLHPIPAGVDFDAALFAWPIGLGVAVGRRLQLAPEAYITVLGNGVSALAATAGLAVGHPATRLLSDDPLTAKIAAKWSLKHRGVAEAGRRHDQQAVVVFGATGGGDPLSVAAGMLRPRGRVAWCADGLDASREGLDGLRWIEGELFGHVSASIAEALSLLEAGRIDVTSLPRRRIEFDDAGLALSTGRPEELDGTVVVVGGDPRRDRRTRAVPIASV